MDIPSKNDFWFLPLGGSGEIGMNLNLYGHNGQWIIVDLGVSFSDRYGIEIIAPDPSYILAQKKHVKAIVLTHAHEDHLGAVPYMLSYFQHCPIYATPFTTRVLKAKLNEHAAIRQTKIFEIPLGGEFDVGDFHFEYVTLTHSIPEPNGLMITTPLGRVFHTGDWKIDPAPLVGDVTDEKRLTRMGEEDVMALVCDSTNVFTEGVSGSEDDVRTELIRVAKEYPNSRIAIACFASNVARLETGMRVASATGRKVCLMGRSVGRMTTIANELGYIKDLPEIVDDQTAMSLPKDKILFLMTGSQGESRAALPRVAEDRHPIVRLDAGDLVIFSSRVIPGNEKAIAQLQNKLVLKDVFIITSHDEEIHVSGHPARDELKQMYEWVKPKMLIPVHGEHRHLKEHAAFGKSCGIKRHVIPQNGTLIDILQGKIIKKVHNGRWCYDGKRMIPMESALIKDRVYASVNGVVSVALSVSKNKVSHSYDDAAPNDSRAFSGLHIIIKGIVNDEEINQELAALKRLIYQVTAHISPDQFESALFKAIRQYFKNQYNKKPLVFIHVMRR